MLQIFLLREVCIAAGIGIESKFSPSASETATFLCVFNTVVCIATFVLPLALLQASDDLMNRAVITVEMRSNQVCQHPTLLFTAFVLIVSVVYSLEAARSHKCRRGHQ